MKHMSRFILFLFIIGDAQQVTRKIKFAFKEEQSVGSEVGSLRNHKNDIFQQKDKFHMFSVDRNTGDISSRVVFDRELIRFTYPDDEITFFVVSGPLVIEVKVQILDINDNVPLFPVDTYKFNLYTEEKQISDYILPTADDPDKYSKTKYEIHSVDFHAYFELLMNNNVLILKLISLPNLQNKPKELLVNISACDEEIQQCSYMLVAISNITEANNNAPQFTQNSYNVELFENITIGKKIVQVTAEDHDSGANGMVKYSLHQTEQFMIQPLSGEISLKSLLDAEKRLSHKIIVVASDNGTSPKLSSTIVSVTVLDCNDNPPHVNIQYTSLANYQILEGTKVNWTIADVLVTDGDQGNVEISVSINNTNYFELKQKSTKEYTLITKMEIDRELTPYFDVTLVAKELNVIPQLETVKNLHIVIGDINDNAPVFEKSLYNFSVLESTPISKSLLKVVATDRDAGKNGLVTYEITRVDADILLLNETTGDILVAKTLDYEKFTSISFQICAIDQGNPSRLGWSKVNIEIQDVNDNVPYFSPEIIIFNVTENSAVGTIVGRITAVDVDTVSSAGMWYRGISNEFNINYKTGEVTTLKVFDRENQDHFEFDVIATDEGGLEGSGRVHVNIDDINDCIPTFSQSSYNISINENFPVNKVAFYIDATDLDEAKNARKLYSAHFNVDTFAMNTNNGGVILKEDLSHIKTKQFEFAVMVRDAEGLPGVSFTNVLLNVLPASKKPPGFIQAQYHFNVTENNHLVQTIGRVRAMRPVSHSSEFIAYQILGGKNLFTIDAVSGLLYTNKIFDYEVSQQLEFQIEAADILDQNLSLRTIVNVQVDILDVNDNRPEFIKESDTVNIIEGAPISHTVYKCLAIDLDSGENSLLHYELINSTGPFNVTSNDCHVFTTGPIDYEIVHEYEVYIQASDLGKPPLSKTFKLMILIHDSNDNPPVFATGFHLVHLAENSTVGTLVTVLNATDEDSGENGKVRYFLGTNCDNFSLQQNGSLFLTKYIDREKQKKFVLVVIAKDKGFPVQKSELKLTILVADVNDNFPVFEKQEYTFHLHEESSRGTVIGIVSAKDDDEGLNGDVFYSLDSDDFSITLTDGKCEISSLRKFDSENGDLAFTVNIKASDQGIPSHSNQVKVNIIVDNINDHVPIFSQSSLYMAGVVEETSKDEEVIKIKAIDDDVNPLPLIYTFVLLGDRSIDVFSAFWIDRHSGIVYTKRDITSDMKTFYEVTVSVEEVGSGNVMFNYQKLIIFIVPLVPRILFHEYFMLVSISETTEPFKGVISSPFPAKNLYRVTNYSISDESVPFSIRSNTGLLQVSRPLDHKVRKFYQFNVFARGSWKKNKQLVYSNSIMMIVYVIAKNNHVPSYPKNPERYTVPEDWPVRKPFAVLKTAIDQDVDLCGQVQYSINSMNPSDAPIRLMPLTRELFLTELLNREKTDVISLRIFLTDLAVDVNDRLFNSFTIYITVTDVNDNPPLIKSTNHTSIFEGEPTGTTVMNIQAEDPDKGETHTSLKYEISSGNDNESFHLNTTTGKLMTTKVLDLSQKSLFSLTITVTEDRVDDSIQSLHTIQVITVQVLDVNNNKPKFTKRIFNCFVEENLAVGTVISNLNATDDDVRVENVKMTFGLVKHTDVFVIDPETGVLLTNALVDREEQSFYMIEAFVRNVAFPHGVDTCIINITIQDVNDMAPIFFGGRKVKLHLLENQPPQVIYTFSIKDDDEGMNAVVKFSLISSNEFLFAINESNGELLVLHSLDREKRKRYKFAVVAENIVTPFYRTLQNVTLIVDDENDENPVFDKRSYQVQVEETASLNTTIIQVHATDKDSTSNAIIIYSLNDEHFRINPNTGQVYSVAELDYEETKQYQLEIRATDSASKFSDSCLLFINVLDMNDNAPVFTKSVYEKFILSVQTDYVLHVKAIDADLDGKQRVTYSFQPSSHHFTIKPYSGEIYIKRNTKLNPGQYRLHVQAVDDGGYQKSHVQVFITIGNNNIVSFLNKSAVYTMDENPAKDYVVGKVVATAANGERVSYSVVQTTNPKYAFAMRSDSGEIYINNSRSVDYERFPTIMLGVLGTIRTGINEFSSYLTIVIHLRDINDNNPQIIPLNRTYNYMESDAENFSPHVLATFDVKDDDRLDLNKLTVVIVSGNEDGMFDIAPRSTVMRLSKPIDYEKKKEHRLVVRVYDGGIPPRFSDSHYTLLIEDRNDNPPVFEDLKPVHVNEQTKTGSVIGQVNASDVDVSTDHILYELVGDAVAMFAIDEYLGNIILLKKLDYEKVRMYELTVSAFDGRYRITGSLSIYVEDANDHVPIFSKKIYDLSVRNSIKKGTYIAKVLANDLDSGLYGMVQYKLDPPVDAYTIEEETGIIFTNKEYKFPEDTNVIELGVVAFDSNGEFGSLQASASVLLEVFGKKMILPEFEKNRYNMQISEGASVGAIVGKVGAYFAGSLQRNIKYEISDGNVENSFVVDLLNGIVTVNQPLDRETYSRFNLELVATVVNQPDSFIKCTVAITVVDINDNSPVFERRAYNLSVLEEEDVGEALLIVKATDADDILTDNGQVEYEIHSGQDEYEWLSIDRYSGVVRTKRRLDREIRPFIQLTIKAADYKGSGRTDFTSLNITVLDRNDHTPQFRVDVPTIHDLQIEENQKAGAIVFKAHADDPDEGSNGLVSYNVMNGTGHDLFYMEESVPGWVYTKIPLDYEKVPLYNLTIVARDHGIPPLTSSFEYRIAVKDVNEFKPQFVEPAFSFAISANLEVGQLIGKVRAVDKDGGEAGVIRYTLDQTTDKFAIDSKTGEIRVQRDLRYMTIERNNRKRRDTNADSENYSLTLRADNGPNDTLFSLAEATIVVNYSCFGCSPVEHRIRPVKDSMTGSTLLIVFASVSLLVLVLFLVCCVVYCRRKRTCLYHRKHSSVGFCKARGDLASTSVERELLPNGSIERELYRSGHSSFDRIHTHLFSEYPDHSAVTKLSSETSPLNENSERSAGDKASTFSFGIYHEQVVSQSDFRPFVDGISNLEKEKFLNPHTGGLTNSTSETFEEDTKKPVYNYKQRLAGSGASVARGSHESLKDFKEEGGGEAAGGMNVGNLLYAKLAEVEDEQEGTMDGLKPFQEEGVLSQGGSLSTIMASDEEDNDYEWQTSFKNKKQFFASSSQVNETTLRPPVEIPLNVLDRSYPPQRDYLYHSNVNSPTVGKCELEVDFVPLWRSSSENSQYSRISLSDINLSDDECI